MLAKQNHTAQIEMKNSKQHMGKAENLHLKQSERAVCTSKWITQTHTHTHTHTPQKQPTTRRKKKELKIAKEKKRGERNIINDTEISKRTFAQGWSEGRGVPLRHRHRNSRIVLHRRGTWS